MFTLTFWKDAFERAVKTVAQAAVAVLAANATGLLDVDWLQIASVAGLAGLVSILTSVGSGAVTKGDASLVPKHAAQPRSDVQTATHVLSLDEVPLHHHPDTLEYQSRTRGGSDGAV